jgi:hypothetical protein
VPYSLLRLFPLRQKSFLKNTIHVFRHAEYRAWILQEIDPYVASLSLLQLRCSSRQAL